jgi:5-carboxyvanillate decarboxylase
MTDRFPKNPPRNPNPPYKRIATEEAWIPEDIMNLYIREISENKIADPGFHQLWGFFAGDSDLARNHRRRIIGLDEERIGDMDASGIDMQVLALGSPGVQLFDPETATSLAASANDQMAEGISKHPERFVGLAAFSPLDPDNAAKELERGVTKLGLRGGRVAGRADLFASKHAFAADDTAIPVPCAGRSDLRFCMRHRSACAATARRRHI